jgi:fatty-acyl-CoA synthase
MAYQLTVPAIMRQAETFSAHVEIVSRRPDRQIHRYCYGDMIRRAKQLAAALQDLGVRPGDRVGTFGGNHHQHLEAYFAVPSIGAVLHTVNTRLHPMELAAIVEHAHDRVMIVDASLLPLFNQWRVQAALEHVIVMGDGSFPDTIEFERLVAEGDAARFTYPVLDEWDAAAMCYTSGTTGRPKGVLYSHRAIVLEAMHWTAADVIGASRRDVMLAVVPMFHINGWGLPFTAALVGAKLVLPGPFLDAMSLLELVDQERVSLSAGVPTVWLDVLALLEKESSFDTSTLRTLVIGGSAAPKSLVERFDRRGIRVLHAWGMTETTAVATVSSWFPELELTSPLMEYKQRAKQGRSVPFVEIRARSAAGFVPWDGRTMGELEVRGPTVAGQYFNSPATDASFTEDGWFRTGDIVTIDQWGYIELQDRIKDLIKSGGEWISSVALESAIMSHPAVGEAAVVAVPHPKWGERPLACVVLKPGYTVSLEELRDHLAQDFAKWWLPDWVEFVDRIPRTSTGKFLKSALRERYAASEFKPSRDASD